MIAVYLLFSTEFWVWYAMGAIGLILIFVTAFGAFNINANWFVKSINRGEKKGIALTFDDGPDPKFTPEILKILDDHRIVGTFFVIGKKVESYPEILKEIEKRGHIIGNHSFSHSPTIPFFSKTKLEADITHCTNIIKTLTGRHTKLFRPPFGVTNPRYAKVMKSLDLLSIGWNVRSFDTILKDPKQLFSRIKNRLKDGSILLFHDTQEVTLQTLPKMIRYCEQEGIKILPLDQLINKPLYEKE